MLHRVRSAAAVAAECISYGSPPASDPAALPRCIVAGGAVATRLASDGDTDQQRWPHRHQSILVTLCLCYTLPMYRLSTLRHNTGDIPMPAQKTTQAALTGRSATL